MNLLNRISYSKTYWLALLILGLSLESAALYYQYILDEWPCVVCIQIRIWVAGFIVLSIISLLAPHSKGIIRGLHTVNSVLMIGLVERSWTVLAVERGWTFSDCTMNSGLPWWFALDKWIPSIFEVKTSCGYTPYIVYQISMAEILMAVSVVLLLISLLLLLEQYMRKTRLKSPI